jgi:hypothetical protein
MSKILTFHEKNYAGFKISLPEDVNGILEYGAGNGELQTAVSNVLTFINGIISGPLPPPSFDEFVIASHTVSSLVQTVPNFGVLARTSKCPPRPLATLSCHGM